MPPGDHVSLKGWYQRPLPPGLIPFSSNRGRQLFKEALARGGGEGYFALAEQFQTQSTPSYCGPGTLAMVLNALALDPKRIWKGSWRWFSEEMLETCDARKSASEPLAGVENQGISFEEFLFLAECNGAHVRAFRATPEEANSPSLARFRAAVHSATHRTDLHLVASFSRKVLGQTGSGHYSPVGAYHAQSDMALVMDVARFKYPPYWAPVSMLWKAVCAMDEATGKGRGYYLMSKGKLSTPAPTPLHASGAGDTGVLHEIERETRIFTPLSAACRIAVDKHSWSRLAEHFCSVLPKQLQEMEQEGRFNVERTEESADAAASLNASSGLVFRALLHSLPVELSSIFIMYTHDLSQRMVEQYQRQERQKLASAASGAAQAAISSAATAASTPGSCDASHACQVHPPTSSLYIYNTLLPKRTPHSHSHSIPTVHALHPLLHAISSTRLFHVLKQAGIDLHAVKYTQTTNGARETPEAITTALPVDASAEGGLGFHLLASSSDGELELAALLLLACPQQVFSLLPPALQSHLDSLRRTDALPASLQTEVRNLRSQMGILADFCACGAGPSVQGNANPNVDPADERDNEVLNSKLEQALSSVMQAGEHHEGTHPAFAALTPPPPATPAAPAAHRGHRFVGGTRAARAKR